MTVAPIATDIRESVESALSAVSADIDYRTWWRIASAVKSALGEAGFESWDAWSRQSDLYNAADARSTWRAVKPELGITVATLYWEARRRGWSGNAAVPVVDDAEKERREALRRHAERRRAEDAARAATTAAKMLELAEPKPHPYFADKGFPDLRIPVYEELALLPLCDAETGEILSLQTIRADGSKCFLKGSHTKGCVNVLAHRKNGRVWYCEGFTTALSIERALIKAGREGVVIACFSAQTLKHVASRSKNGVVAADHDLYICMDHKCKHRWDAPWGRASCPACGCKRILPPAGEKHARQSGLPFWLSPEPGDANDFMLRHGVDALAENLLDFERNVQR